MSTYSNLKLPVLPRPKPGSVIIAPSVLSADFARLAADVKQVMQAGCSWIHLDVMDNHFVPNLTFGPPVVHSLRKRVPKALFDAHLMVSEPESLIDPFAKAGVQILTVHQEACGENLEAVIAQIHNYGMAAGVSIKPGTPLSTIEPILGMVELVLVMTVEPGFGGQSLIATCLNKVRTLASIRNKKKYKYVIQVDGGINAATIGLVTASGGEILVAGSAVFSGGTPAENITKLLKAAKAH